MKKITLCFALLMSGLGFSQNDNLCDAIQLTVDATSAGDAYTNIDATAETDEVEGSCFNGGVNGSVWFTFDAPASGNVIVTTDIAGGTLTDTEIAVYEAPSDCSDASSLGMELGCNQDGGEVVNFNSIVQLGGLTSGTTYYIQVDRWGTADNGTFGIEVQALSACLDPSDLAAASSETTAGLSWIENGSATLWNIEWGAAGFGQGNGTVVNGVSNPYELAGLTGETDYEYYVQSDCDGETTAWVGPFAFTTTGTPPANNTVCNAIEIVVDATSTGDAFTNENASAQTGEPIPDCFNGGINGSVWFWFTAPASGNVNVTTDIAGGTLTDTEVAVYEAPSDCSDTSSIGAEVGCDQDSGDIVGFNSIVALSGLTAGNVYYIQVDRWGTATDGTFGIEVQGLAACLDPSNLNANNISDTMVDLGWTENGGATLWNIEWGAAGFTPGTGTTETGVTENPFTLTGLTAETDYEFYVQTDCEGDTSPWVGPFAFSTFPPPPANDNCSGVIDLGGETSPLMASTVGATNDFDQDCLTNAGAPDVVYSIVVPDGATLTIGQSENAYDSKHRLAYGGTCPGDTVIDCVDDPDVGMVNYENTTGSDQTVYWVQSAFSTGNGDYTLEWDLVTLGVDEFSLNSFSYYPNPVTNTLMFDAQSEIKKVSIFNILGQEVLKVSPNSVNSIIEMSSLNSGTYFVKVSINDVTKTVRIIKK